MEIEVIFIQKIAVISVIAVVISVFLGKVWNAWRGKWVRNSTGIGLGGIFAGVSVNPEGEVLLKFVEQLGNVALLTADNTRMFLFVVGLAAGLGSVWYLYWNRDGLAFLGVVFIYAGGVLMGWHALHGWDFAIFGVIAMMFGIACHSQAEFCEPFGAR